jgi:hypothetical protein
VPADWSEWAPRRPLPHEVQARLDAGLEPPDYFFGSSDDFGDFLRRDYPHLLVPEGGVVCLDGGPNWRPAYEDRAAPLCPHCLGDFGEQSARRAALKLHRVGPAAGPPCPYCRGRVHPGSALYCPKCGASGYEAKLAAQRAIAGLPPREPSRSRPLPAPAARAAPRPTRRERRRLRFGPGGAGPTHDGPNEG